ncbi:hypothetical protein IWW54_005390 [Coemansia sp. RSA 2705]|nr:hypothetical protein IWW54_005390 [Coemansia sp. RSA 2705]
MTSPGVGTYGDRPPSSLNLFPDRKGFKAGGKGRGTGDSAQKYQPPPKYTANARYAAVKHGQTVQPYSFKSKSPVVYYASSTRKQFPGAWGFGFYRIYPYPWWAYGSGTWYYAPNQSQPGASFYTDTITQGLNTYVTSLRNITVVDATNVPLIGDQSIFGKTTAGFTDFNNGTIQIAPCGNQSSSALQVLASDCQPIVLDIKLGSVVIGQATALVRDDITFFELAMGNQTATLRTMAISSTTKSRRGGIIAGIVVGAVSFVVLCGVGIATYVYWKQKRMRRIAHSS